MKWHELVNALVTRAGGSFSVAKAMRRPTFQGTLHKIATGKVESPSRQSAERIAAHFKIDVNALYSDRIATQEALRLGLAGDTPELNPRLSRGVKPLSQDEIIHSADGEPASSVRAYSDTNDRQAPVLEWACLGVALYKNASEVEALRFEPVPKRASSLVKWFIVEQDHRRFGISKGDMVALDPMQPGDEPEEMKRHVFQTASGKFVLAEYRTLAGNSFEALPDSGAPLEKDRHGLIVVARVRGVWEA